MTGTKSDFITLDYFYKFIGYKKVYLWGASNFLKKLLEEEVEPNPNILGIIDRNDASWGKKFGNYQIYPPKILREAENVNILVTVCNYHHEAYKCIKKEVEKFYPLVDILDNLFRETNHDSYIKKIASNNLYLLDSFGDKHSVTHINGLQINWLGENGVIEIGGTPIPKFENCIINCGSNCHIKIGSSIHFIKNLYADISATNSTLYIGDDFSLDGAELLMRGDKNMKIYIGNDCMFSKDIYIRCNDGHVVYDIDSKEIYNKPEDIEIGNHVWLCQNTTLLKGTKIKDNTVVANSSLVNKPFEKTNILLAGIPAKIIKENCNWNRKNYDKSERYSVSE